jgi:hypothetical protein
MGTITGTDIPDGTPNSEHQCWNADFEDTYQQRYDQTATGDEDTCTVAIDELPPAPSDESSDE